MSQSCGSLEELLHLNQSKLDAFRKLRVLETITDDALDQDAKRGYGRLTDALEESWAMISSTAERMVSLVDAA